MSTGISVKLPLAYSADDGPYGLTKTLPETVKQNFKNLVLTVPGEKVMDPDFGVGIHDVLFENENSDRVEEFQERLFDQTKKYLSFVDIVNVNTTLLENTWVIQIHYFINPLGISDEFSLEIVNEQRI